MTLQLSFDHLTSAPHYLDHLDDVKTNDVGFTFLNFIKEQFPLDVFSIFITNYTTSNYKNVIYVLRCERGKIELYEKNNLSENNLVYDFYDDTISLNSKIMSPLYKTFFKKRLSEIILDLKQQKSVIFEEKL